MWLMDIFFLFLLNLAQLINAAVIPTFLTSPSRFEVEHSEYDLFHGSINPYTVTQFHDDIPNQLCHCSTSIHHWIQSKSLCFAPRNIPFVTLITSNNIPLMFPTSNIIPNSQLTDNAITLSSEFLKLGIQTISSISISFHHQNLYPLIEATKKYILFGFNDILAFTREVDHIVNEFIEEVESIEMNSVFNLYCQIHETFKTAMDYVFYLAHPHSPSLYNILSSARHYLINRSNSVITSQQTLLTYTFTDINDFFAKFTMETYNYVSPTLNCDLLKEFLRKEKIHIRQPELFIQIASHFISNIDLSSSFAGLDLINVQFYLRFLARMKLQPPLKDELIHFAIKYWRNLAASLMKETAIPSCHSIEFEYIKVALNFFPRLINIDYILWAFEMNRENWFVKHFNLFYLISSNDVLSAKETISNLFDKSVETGHVLNFFLGLFGRRQMMKEINVILFDFLNIWLTSHLKGRQNYPQYRYFLLSADTFGYILQFWIRNSGFETVVPRIKNKGLTPFINYVISHTNDPFVAAIILRHFDSHIQASSMNLPSKWAKKYCGIFEENSDNSKNLHLIPILFEIRKFNNHLFSPTATSSPVMVTFPDTVATLNVASIELLIRSFVYLYSGKTISYLGELEEWATFTDPLFRLRLISHFLRQVNILPFQLQLRWKGLN